MGSIYYATYDSAVYEAEIASDHVSLMVGDESGVSRGYVEYY